MGLGDLTDRRPGQLSGGQAQRVAVARALAGKPTVVTASGASLVMVTHDARVAQWCQRRVEVRDGLIHDDRMVR